MRLITPPLLFISFILSLLVTLSAPIIDKIYLFSLSTEQSDFSGSAQFGVFGYCVDANGVKTCSETKLGYTVDTATYELRVDNNDTGLTALSGAKPVVGLTYEYTDLLSKTSTLSFVANPVATGLTFLALVFSLLMCPAKTARHASLVTLLTTLLAAIASTGIFLYEIICVAIARGNLDGPQLQLHYGNALWMSMIASGALWLAVFSSFVGMCFWGGRARVADRY